MSGEQLISRGRYLTKIYSIMIGIIVILNISIFTYISKIMLTKEYEVVQNTYNRFSYSPQLICSLVSCNVIVTGDKISLYNVDKENAYAEPAQEYDRGSFDHKLTKLFGNVYLYNGLSYRIMYQFDNKDEDFFIDISTSNLIETFIVIFISITLITIFVIYLTASYILKHERNQFHYYITKNTSKVQNDIFYYLTLNIHHEMNTPLFVVKNNTEKVLRNTDKPENKELLTTNLQYLEQLFSIIDNMKEFKRVKHSNGDKTIYDLCQVSVNLINEIKTEKFDEYIVDEKLKKYKVDHTTGLENGDIVNNIINHIKNSLNANAGHFLIQLDDSYHRPGFIKILLIDSGNGIPDKIIKKLYQPNIVGNTTVRGEGMGLYLNNLILSKVGGSDKLESTIINKGTIFSITVPVEEMKG